MDTLLIAVTVVSLAIAAAMAFVVMRIVREERRRSEARVAALAELSAERVTSIAATSQTRRAVRPLSAGDIEIDRASAAAPSVPTLFAEPERRSPWGRRLAVIGALAAVLAIGTAVTLSRGHPRPAATAAMRAGTAVQAAPLELLSLDYQQQPDRMTITGLVQNPRNGSALSHVTATAFLFTADGTFLASGRAALDYTTLGPGDESPFVISVPVTGTVSRYRVGFRDGEGRVIAHVDRRALGTLAEREPR